MHFHPLLALVLGELDKRPIVDAIAAEVRLDHDAASLSLLIFQPLRFRHNRRCWSGLLVPVGVDHANTPAHHELFWQKHR